VRRIFADGEARVRTDRLHALIMWPATFGGYRANDSEQLINGALEVKHRLLLPSMHYSTLRQFVVRVYAGEDFIGTEDDGFRFSTDKSKGVWRESDRAQILVVEAETNLVLQVKEEVRRMCGVGRHALHTTDSIEEFRQVWQTATRLRETGFHTESLWMR